MLRFPHAACAFIGSIVFLACARPAPEPSGPGASSVAWRVEARTDTSSAVPIEASAPVPDRAAPLRVFLRGGPKTHGPGQHDHPRFVHEWEPLLEARGAVVEGALRFPTKEELERTDVLVSYAADGASIRGDDRAHLERFLARGGGLVFLHDAVCGDDPHWFKTVAGGAWEHGYSKYKEGTTDLYFTDVANSITDGVAHFRFEDELYWDLHMDPAARVLANGFHSVFDITPQMWTFEKADYRAFVSIQGHLSESFSHPAWRTLLLRGIAWAGKRDADALLAAGEAAALRYPKGGPTRPEDAAKALELHPDFELSLIAAEPIVEKPISVDWDAKGRMWVAESRGYPDKERYSGIPARDSITILTDANGDGRMDARKEFHRGLDLVTSLVFHRDGVIVSAAPEILFLRDTNGDDVCDKIEVVFTGFGFGDTHAVISNLRWGLDGWIYGTQGYSGGASRNVKNAGGKDFGHIGNGLFRFRPDGSAIEMVSSYGSNTWGLDFSSDGELFFSMANGDHLRHVVMPESALADARYGDARSWANVADHDRVAPIIVHHDAPYAQIDFVGGFTAVSGCCLYTGGAWPKEWENAAFVAEPTVHIVHHDVLTPDGVTFKATKARDAEFFAGKDLWFRPIHMRVGPDGAMYVLDFYNQAVVHNDTRGPQHGPTNAAKRPDRDDSHGRIWRVQHKQAKSIQVVDRSKASPNALVTTLGHPNSWASGTAMRLLVERAGPDVLAELERTVEGGLNLHARVQAGWCLQRLGRGADAVEPLLRDADSTTRVHGIRIARLDSSLAQPEAFFARMPTVDGNLHARERLAVLEALASLRVIDEDTLAAWPLLADDPWSRSVILGMAIAAPHEALFHLGPADVTGGNDSLLDAFAAQLVIPRNRAALETTLVELSARSQSGPGIVLEVLGALSRSFRDNSREPAPARIVEALSKLLERPTAGSRIHEYTARLAMRLNAADALGPKLEPVAGYLRARIDEGGPLSKRLDALETLIALPSDRVSAIPRTKEFLAPNIDPEVQERVVRLLGAVDHPASTRACIESLPSMSPKARTAALEQMLARADRAELLLHSLETKETTLAELGPQFLHRLRTHPDAKIAQRAAKLFLELGHKPSAKVSELVERFLPIASQPGDATNGKLVFEKNCIQCHRVDGQGTDIGPDLTGMGTHGAKDLLPIILDPNRAVEAGYAEWHLETKDGQLVTGVMAREDARSVVLRSTTGSVEVARADIEWIKNTGRSPMPEGLDSIGAEGFRDLFAYLSGGYAGWRVLSLEDVVSSSSIEGLYDTKRDGNPMVFRHWGIQAIAGVPFEVLDPTRTSSRMNAVVLKGGHGKDWESKLHKPSVVEVKVESAVERVHVLGGIGAWAYPFFRDVRPICTWTWVYADGTTEDVVLKSGVEFGDWIGKHDVPGSEYVEGVLAEESWGQVRTFALEPKRKDAVVQKIVLTSPDGDQAATFFALTAELKGAVRKTAAAKPAPKPVAVEPLELLVVGGGSSHDFKRFFGDADLATLAGAGFQKTRYTEKVNEILPQLEKLDVLELTNNQPLEGAELRKGIFDFVARGGGLLIVHPACWYNWADWPEYNAKLVGGGSRGHGPFGEFEVRIVDAAHPLAEDVPATFRIEDELYRFEPDPKGAAIHVIAVGRSHDGKEQFPVVWTVAREKGRTVGITLGHDGRAHANASYKKLYANAARWVSDR